MVMDAQAPFVAKSSAAMVLKIYISKQGFIVFHSASLIMQYDQFKHQQANDRPFPGELMIDVNYMSLGIITSEIFDTMAIEQNGLNYANNI